MLDPYYVTGFTDGEGCFCVSISPRNFKNVEWEIRPSFSISQNKKSRGVLFRIRDYFGCGSIRVSRKDNTYKYEVRSVGELFSKVVPHFEKYPLQTEKKRDFYALKKVIEIMHNKQHTTPEGLRQIFEILTRIATQKGKRIYNIKKLNELMKV